MHPEELPPRIITLCAVHTSHGASDPTAHAVLFSLGGEFAGRVYPYGARVALCLRHADDVLTARRTLPDGRSFGTGRYAWLTPGVDRLPVPSLSEHVRTVTPTRRPTQPHRPRRFER